MTLLDINIILMDQVNRLNANFPVSWDAMAQ
jgi:hypothetical protein